MERKSPNLKFCYVFGSSFTRYFDLDGIVIYPFVFITETKENTSPRTLKHELTHVEQVRREGPLKFYTNYLNHVYTSWRENGNFSTAFIRNEYEDEAYANESNPLTDDEVRETDWQGPRSENVNQVQKTKKTRKSRKTK